MKEYGVQTSKAHYWAHVCPIDAMIYWYPRRRMVDALDNFREAKIRSAIGRVVPIVRNLAVNGGCIRYTELGYPYFERWDFASAPTDREAGALAEDLFSTACVEGLFLLPVRVCKRYDAYAEQIQGKDFECDLGRPGSVDIEVKFDGPGGTWGTGNLFVQTHEGTRRDGDQHDVTERNGHRHDEVSA